MWNPATNPDERDEGASIGSRHHIMMSRPLTVFDQHALKIARRTLTVNKAMVGVIGGPNHAQARQTIYRLTGKHAAILPEHGDFDTARPVMQPNGRKV